MFETELKIGKAPDFLITRGLLAIMHKIIINVRERGHDSRYLMSHASLHMLIKQIRLLVDAKIPNAQFKPDRNHLSRYEDPERGVIVICDIMWNECIDRKSKKKLGYFYRSSIFHNNIRP